MNSGELLGRRAKDRRLLKRLTDKTQALVEANLVSIKRVAKALIAHRVLTRDEVVATVGT